MTVLSNVIASALPDAKRLSEAEPLWVRVAGSDSTEFVKYGSAIYQNGPSVVSTHAISTQDREITLELIDSYNNRNSGGMKFFLAYKAASNIDGLHVFHDGTSWRLRRFITYLITISDAVFNQGNVRRKVVVRSESGNVTLSVYDASDVLIGSQTVNNALDTYAGALPACIHDGSNYSVGDAVTQDGMGYLSIKIDDLQTSGTTDYTPETTGGGIAFDGSATVNVDFNFTMDGTLILGGSSPVSVDYYPQLEGGGITFTGSAQPGENDYEPVLEGGGIAFDGAALVSADYYPIVTGGGIHLSGGAEIMATWNFAMSGGVVFGGEADVVADIAQPLGILGAMTASDGAYSDKVQVVVPTVQNATEYQILRNGAVVRDWADVRVWFDMSVIPDTVYSYTFKARNRAYESAESAPENGSADSDAVQASAGMYRAVGLASVYSSVGAV
jgi:hypothetical protein